MSHVSVKQIAKIEKGQMNPSFLILNALAKFQSVYRDWNPEPILHAI